MKQFSDTTIYLSAYAKLPTDMPSGEVYKSLDIGLIIDYDTNKIEGASITLITDETKEFLKQIITGYNLKNGIEPLVEEIKKRYFGNSQKAICVALKLIYEKYVNWCKEQRP